MSLGLGRYIPIRACPLCGWHGLRFGRFAEVGPPRHNAKCPGCGALERHRAAFKLLSPLLKPEGRVLHVAPEPVVERWLRSLASDYLSIDLMGPAMRQMDLTRLDLPDASYDLVWCSHVLEHIPDDAAAMREMHRVLAAGGRCVIQVPVHRKSTYEDFSITSPQERVKAFGQEDHVRHYGLDIVNRLTSAGFAVDTLNVKSLSPVSQFRHAVNCPGCELVFVGSKAIAAP